ncbi:uncharacterized protein TNCV_3348061 [Trichonephila clavipes]|nr:uncharacterized protein TNCV_3348061 [Trichonephila clavipes]
MRRWVGVKGSTRHGRRDRKCPSAKRLHIVRENTGASSEGATCAWMAADEAAGCTRAFITTWLSSRRLGVKTSEPGLEDVLSLVLVKVTYLGSTGPNTSSQHNQSGLIDELLA